MLYQDLKTKNIFLENGRAIITDFGLVNVARRLCSRYKRPGDIVQVIEEEGVLMKFMVLVTNDLWTPSPP